MILDLFAGPGGWDEGLKTLGITDTIGVELSEDACLTARAAGHERIFEDVASLHPGRFLGIEGLVASPPCQPFSDNGKHGGLDDPRGLLSIEPMRYVKALRPQWVAFEQVRAVLPIWQRHVTALRELGYSAWAGLLDAADYGVPQHRIRAVLVARRGAYADLPKETHGSLSRVSQGEALGWERPHEWRVNTGLDWKKGQPREAAQTIRGDQPATTITTRSVGQWRVYPSGQDYRGLTETEAGVLQTFRPDYPWTGATQLARATQIGNAIPPVLAAAILREVVTETTATRWEVDEHGKRCPA